MASLTLSLHRAAIINPNGNAVIDHSSQTHLKWNQFEHAVQILSTGLRSKLQFHCDFSTKSVPVAYLGRNSPEFLLYLYGLSLNGTVIVPINVRWSAQEILHALVDSSCALLVVDFEFVQTRLLHGVLDGTHPVKDIIIVRYPREKSILSKIKFPGVKIDFHDDILKEGEQMIQSLGANTQVPTSVPVNDALHSIIYTSGTTGKSKGVMLTHLNQVCQAHEKCGRCGYSTNTRYLNVAPMFHVGGLSSAVAVTMAGGTHVFMDRFNAPEAIDLIQQEDINTLVVVPAMLETLLQESIDRKTQLDSIELILVGAQALEAASLKKAIRVCPNARIIQTYACTEACSTMTFADLTRSSEAQSASQEPYSEGYGKFVGECASHSEMKIIDDKCNALPPGICGRIFFRGPSVMKGYWNQDALTSQVLHSGGWLETGDLGYLSQTGQLYICGRQSDVIKTGGEKVHASEVESVLLAIPFVEQAAVVGTPDRKFGEAVTAFVVLKKSESMSELNEVELDGNRETAIDAIQRRCMRQLSRYKCPKKIFVVEFLPINSSGKIIKKAITIPYTSSL